MLQRIQVEQLGLSPAQVQRYRSFCIQMSRTLVRRHGPLGRLARMPDLAFLALLLTSLREGGGEEAVQQRRRMRRHGGADVLAATEIAAKRAGITLVRAAECRDVDTPEDLAAVFEAGAYSAVVGGAITRPKQITERFVKAIEGLD